jgi:Tfp pilus assembly protein FimT
MAVGDVTSGLSASIANNGTVNVQPASGAEWVIHNVYYTGAVEFYIVNGANTIKFDSDTAFGARLGAVFHVNNTQYLQIKNVSGGAINIAYDGVITK